MSNTIQTLTDTHFALVARAASYATAEKSANTKRAYAADFSAFEAWAVTNGLPSMPTTPEVLACYIAGMADAGRKASTIGRAVAGIGAAHRSAGHDPPQGKALSQTMSGIRRQIGTAQAQKSPIMAEELRKMVDACTCARDRALLVLGWLGAFRRSELVSLNVEDVVFMRHGIEVTLRRSKTDQSGEGMVKGLPNTADQAYSPSVLLKALLDESGITTGAIFRNLYGDRLDEEGVAMLVKKYAEIIGLDPSKYSGHSLRSGLATEAAEKGRSLKAIMNQTGHRSERIAMRYVRHATVWNENAAMGLL